MTNISLIFPGQGAQAVGMGKEFYETSPAAKAVFDKAQGVLGNDLLDVVFNGPEEKLKETRYCQPAIVAFSVAALEAFKAHPKFSALNVKFTCGLSLGEYSALIAAGGLSLEDGIRLVQKRGLAMDEACRTTQGKMAAIIGFPKERLKAICGETGAQVANFNSPEQIVISGEAAKVEKAADLIQKEGAKNVVFLPVAGAFHSLLMQPAVDKFSAELAKVNISPLKFPLISNVDARPHTDSGAVAANLPKQIISSVLWEDSVRFMASQGIKTFIEIGPGKILKGLMRKIDPSLKVYNIEKPADIETVFN